MENLNNIYPTKINRVVDWKTAPKAVKELFFNLLPMAKPVCWFGLTVVILLVLQIILVGVFDRLGVSPKVSLIGSSLFYVAVFGGLALVGGLKKTRIVEIAATNLKTQPICKVLIIKRKRQEIKR